MDNLIVNPNPLSTGLTKRRTLSTNTTLTNDDAGSFIVGSAGGVVTLTMPASPRAGYRLQIKPIINAIIINFNGQVLHQAPGYGGHDYEIWTLPYYRENGYVTIEFDGTYWTLTGASHLYYPKVNPLDSQDLAHGQVRFAYDGSTYFTLSQFNRPGGLLVDRQMHAISPTGLKYNKSGTTSSSLNYFYVGNSAANVITGIVDNGGGLCKVALTTALSSCVVGDTVFVDIQGAKGCTEANGRWVGVVTTDTSHVVLTGSAFVNAWTSGGDARVDYLYASATTHATDTTNGVEVLSGDATVTLVGMAYIGVSNAVNDSATNRSVATWFNRRWRNAANPLTADRAITSTTYAEFNSEIRTSFVAWASEDDVRYATTGGPLTPGLAQTMGFTVAFDGTTAEREKIFAVAAATTKPDAILSGAKSGLSEGLHYATVLGKSTTSTLTAAGTSSGSSAPVTLEVQVRQ